MIQYVITKDIYRRLLSFKGRNIVCKRCLKELKIGDYKKESRNSGTSKLYHNECYDQMFIDI